jgi:hypothetical protein
LGLFLVVGGGTCVALFAAIDGATGQCDPAAVQTFQSLPAFPGVEVELKGSAGNGCTDTVQLADTAAFIDHYELVMRDAGWHVARDGASTARKRPNRPGQH